MQNTTDKQALPITLQIQVALGGKNLLATFIGAILGFVVPLLVYSASHRLPQLNFGSKFFIISLVALMGCIYSAKSVYQWCYLAFQKDWLKAVGFAALCEGMLIVSGLDEELHYLGYISLGILMAINAISAGCNIACEGKTLQEIRKSLKPAICKRKAIVKGK